MYKKSLFNAWHALVTISPFDGPILFTTMKLELGTKNLVSQSPEIITIEYLPIHGIQHFDCDQNRQSHSHWFGSMENIA